MNFYINFTKEHRAIDFKAIASPISMQLGFYEGCSKSNAPHFFLIPE